MERLNVPKEVLLSVVSQVPSGRGAVHGLPCSSTRQLHMIEHVTRRTPWTLSKCLEMSSSRHDCNTRREHLACPTIVTTCVQPSFGIFPIPNTPITCKWAEKYPVHARAQPKLNSVFLRAAAALCRWGARCKLRSCHPAPKATCVYAPSKVCITQTKCIRL